MPEMTSHPVRSQAAPLATTLSTEAQAWATGELLARAFVADPVLCYAEPSGTRRARWMALIYRSFVRYAAATGGVERVEGKAAALWLRDETQPSFWRGLRHGSIRVVLALGWRAAWRCLRHEAWCAARVRALGFERFGYVWFLGVDPAAQRSGHGQRALNAALEAMAAHGHETCLLKTESPGNVAYYVQRGFALVDEGVVPATQLRCWFFRRALTARGPS